MAYKAFITSLFNKISQRISGIYSWTELATKKIHASAIHPIFGVLLAIFLTMVAGPIGTYLGAILGWVFTFSWLNTSHALQNYPPVTRFVLSAITPLILWTGMAYLALKVTPHYPSTDEIAEKVVVVLEKALPKPQTKPDSSPKLPEPMKAEPTKPELSKSEPKKVPVGEKQPLVMNLVKTGEFVEWRVKNVSDEVVQPVLFFYALWDLDNPQLNATGPAIQMPVKRIDFINPKTVVGERMNVSPAEHRRLLGVASIYCAGCKDRGYWIYIDYTGGWFAEMIGYDLKGLAFPYSAFSRDDKEIEKVAPPAIRQMIR
jgi:hypothetical protein